MLNLNNGFIEQARNVLLSCTSEYTIRGRDGETVPIMAAEGSVFLRKLKEDEELYKTFMQLEASAEQGDRDSRKTVDKVFEGYDPQLEDEGVFYIQRA